MLVTAFGLCDGAATGVRIGRVITALVAAFLLFDAVIHILNIAPVVEGSRTLGFDVDVMPWIGALCAQLRIEAPLFSTMLFPVYVGVALWAGLWLRDARVRDLMAAR